MDTKRGLSDRPYAQQMELVTTHWSGKHQRVVKGIALLTLLWTDGQDLIPCDFRVYDKPAGGQSKNAHFQAMLQRAKQRGFAPEYVPMDSWYSGLENLKWIRDSGWLFWLIPPMNSIQPGKSYVVCMLEGLADNCVRPNQ